MNVYLLQFFEWINQLILALIAFHIGMIHGREA